jgi:Flp pilus assembly protein TadB
MAESQAQHRQQLEASVISSNCRSQDRGPILGFLLAAGVIGVGCFLVMQGKEISGLAALIAALAAVVVPFLYGKREQRRELEKKQGQLTRPPQDDWEYTSQPKLEAGNRARR